MSTMKSHKKAAGGERGEKRGAQQSDRRPIVLPPYRHSSSPNVPMIRTASQGKRMQSTMIRMSFPLRPMLSRKARCKSKVWIWREWRDSSACYFFSFGALLRSYQFLPSPMRPKQCLGSTDSRMGGKWNVQLQRGE